MSSLGLSRDSRRLWFVLRFCAIATFVYGCNAGESVSQDTQNAESDLLEVVATSTMIADWTAQVGGEAIALEGILEPGADPHIYEPVPADTVALEEADLILYNGYNLEPNLIKLMQSAGQDARQVAVGEIVTPLDFDYQGQKAPDPHVWGDVENVVQMVELIRDELVELAPEHEADFTQNAEAYIEELTQLDGWIADQIDTIPPEQRQLVTTHDAFQYYTEAYGMEVAGTLIGISTEERPSAQTVQKLAETVEASGVPAIFAETTLNPRLITTVAEEAGVQLSPQELYSDSVGAANSDGDTYINMMVANTEAIVTNLGGQYTPFEPQ